MPDIQIDATGDEDDEALAAHAAEAARAQAQSGDLHPATADLVDRFAAALHDKLLAAQRKYGYSDNWQRDDWMDECREHLRQHLKKGDPRDVAAYCAFLWHHGAPTVANKSLTQLRAECEAAAPQQAAEPVAWTRQDTINDGDGRPIGMDEPRVHWCPTPPDDELGWAPLYTHAAPADASDVRVPGVSKKTHENAQAALAAPADAERLAEALKLQIAKWRGSHRLDCNEGERAVLNSCALEIESILQALAAYDAHSAQAQPQDASATPNLASYWRIVAEAAEVLQMVLDSGVKLPPNWRWPLLDELSGLSAMMLAAQENPNG